MERKVISPKKIKPFEQRKSGMCGPAALRSLLSIHGIKMSEADLARICHASAEDGTSPEMMAPALEKLGFRVRSGVWQGAEASWDILNHWINDMGLPVLVDWFSEFHNHYDGHYSVAFKLNQRHIWLADPEPHLKKERIRKIQREDFLRAWHDWRGNYLERKSDLFSYWWLVAFRAPLSKMK